MARNGLGRIAANVLSMFANDAVNRATTFVLYAMVARSLGTYEFGQMSLALTIFYIFQVFAVAGLKTLVTREVAKDRSRTDEYLANGSMLVSATSLLSIAALALFVQLMGYTPETGRVILLLSLGLFPFSLSVLFEALFQAWERMHFIAYANAAVNLLRIGGAYLVLSGGFGLDGLILLLLASYLAVAVVEAVFLALFVARPRFSVKPAFILGLARAASTFLGIDGIVAIMTSLNVLLLSKLGGEREIGLFSAATQLMVPLLLFYQSMAVSVFPIMCRRFDSSFRGMRSISEGLIALLLAIAMPSMIGLFVLAEPVLHLLYGSKGFEAAEGAVRIMVWSLMFTALTAALGQVLLAGLRERVTLRIVAVDALVGLLLGFVLIGQFGLTGAALAALLTKAVDFVQHYLAVSRLLPNINWLALTWKPAGATILMGFYLVAIREQQLFLTVASAALLYGTAYLALEIWSAGGVARFRASLISLRSRVG